MIYLPGAHDGRRATAGNWAGAELAGSCGLHVTLVPPVDVRDVSRQDVIRALQARAGDAVQVCCTRYHRAVLCSDPSHRVCFWEVDSLKGLAPSEQYAPQMNLYHVTDVPSLTHTAKAKEAKDALEQLKGQHDQNAPLLWNIDTIEWPLITDATITLY